MNGLYLAKVLSNTQVAQGFYNLVLEDPVLAQRAEPGQFLNIRVAKSTAPLLRRPISIHWVEENRVEILFQVVGQGTSLLAEVKQGELLDVQGPLGQGFRIEPAGRQVLLGGGMGIAPLGYLAQRLQGQKITCLLGSRDAESFRACGGERLRSLGLETQISTDDGSLGHKGLVTELLKAALAEAQAEKIMIYACGPKPMLSAVAGFALDKGIPCQVSLEEHMACGVGACLGCVCQGVSADGQESRKRVCADGPVFDVREVGWR